MKSVNDNITEALKQLNSKTKASIKRNKDDIKDNILKNKIQETSSLRSRVEKSHDGEDPCGPGSALDFDCFDSEECTACDIFYNICPTAPDPKWIPDSCKADMGYSHLMETPPPPRAPTPPPPPVLTGGPIKIGDELVFVNQHTSGSAGHPDGLALGVWRLDQSPGSTQELHALNPDKLASGAMEYTRVKFRIMYGGPVVTAPSWQSPTMEGSPVRFGDTIKIQTLYYTEGWWSLPAVTKNLPIQVHPGIGSDVIAPAGATSPEAGGNSVLAVNISSYARRNDAATSWTILNIGGGVKGGRNDGPEYGVVNYGDNITLQSQTDPRAFMTTWGYGHGMGHGADGAANGAGVITSDNLWTNYGTRQFKAIKYSDYAAGVRTAPLSEQPPDLTPDIVMNTVPAAEAPETAIKIYDELVIVNQHTSGDNYPNGLALGVWRDKGGGWAISQPATQEIHALNPDKLGGTFPYERVKFRMTQHDRFVASWAEKASFVDRASAVGIKYGDSVKIQTLYNTDIPGPFGTPKNMPIQVLGGIGSDVWHSSATPPTGTDVLAVNTSSFENANIDQTKWKILTTSGTNPSSEFVNYGDEFVLQSVSNPRSYMTTWGFGHGMGRGADAIANGAGVTALPGLPTGSDKSRRFKAVKYSEYEKNVRTVVPPPPTDSATATAAAIATSTSAQDAWDEAAEERAAAARAVTEQEAAEAAGAVAASTFAEANALGGYSSQAAVDSDIKTWADNVVGKVAAMAQSCTAPVSTARQCPGGAPSGNSFEECEHQARVWDDLNNNPILRHFVHAWTPTQSTDGVSDYLSTPIMTNNPMGIGWLRVPTTPSNSFSANWETNPNNGLPHSNNRPLPKSEGDYEINGDHHLTMLIARKFTEDESKKIYDALRNQSGSTPRGAKTSFGKDFVFTKEGHISFRLPGTAGTTRATGAGNSQHTYLNPFINVSAQTSSTSQEAGWSSSPDPTNSNSNMYIPVSRDVATARQTNTMAGVNTAQGTGKFSIVDKSTGMEILYAMGPKCVMNKASTYILYTPADEDHIINGYKYKATGQTSKEYEASVAGTERYYLLYNPINSIEFRRFYQSLIQMDNGSLAPTPEVKNYTGNGRTVYDRTGCGTPIMVDGWSSIIARYCNAFTVTGLKDYSGYFHLKHYADPICPFALGSSSAFNAFKSNNNVTHQSTREVLYRKDAASTAYDSYSLFLQANDRMQRLSGLQTWACPTHSAKARDSFIQEWLRDNNMINKNSTSFMKDLINSILNEPTGTPWVSTINRKSIGRLRVSGGGSDGGTYTSDGFDDLIDAPACIVPVQHHTTCTQILSVSGVIDKSLLGQDMECGGVGEEGFGRTLSEIEAANTGSGTPHTCTTLTKVPECPEISLGGVAGEDVTDVQWGGTTRTTGCCLTASGSYIDCPQKAATEPFCTYTGGTPSDAQLTPEQTAINSLGIQAGSATSRIAGATTAALVFKDTYPKNVPIITKADVVLSDAEGYLTRLGVIESDILAIPIEHHHITVQENMDNLLLDITRTENINKEISSIISDKYLFGFKKMYVYGGIGAVVLLILLIVLLIM